MKRWEPAIELTKKEQFIIKRLKRTRKLFAFLRLHRHELFDANFQEELEGMDRRWQMVLGCLNADEPAFAQGTLQAFRERLIAADLDRRLLERTIELARQTKEFDWKKLPKDLRLAIDSRPFEGAGRVEDTFNLLGHAARKLVTCAARLTDST